MGEDPYAEWFGDIPDNKTLSYGDLKNSYHEDLLTLKRLKAADIPVVTVLFSGRPLYVNEEINLSSAFVAARLPGTEGRGSPISCSRMRRARWPMTSKGDSPSLGHLASAPPPSIAHPPRSRAGSVPPSSNPLKGRMHCSSPMVTGSATASLPLWRPGSATSIP